MTRSRSMRGAWVIAFAIVATACAGGSDRGAAEVEQTSAVSSGADDATHADHDGRHDHLDDHDHADDHLDVHDPEHHDAARPDAALHDPEHHGDRGDTSRTTTLGPLTTEETLARLASLDPARAAAAHDHSAHEHRAVVHPNGIRPARIVIDAIGVDADVIDLGLNPDGTMEVPTDFAQAGWFTPGVPPGRVGPAIIAGHVDSRSGPAVFFRLTELEVGDEIRVLDPDGEEVVFAVRAMEQHAKDAFPTDRVYRATQGPELRLITCGGVFDRDERSYRDNIIVYAERIAG